MVKDKCHRTLMVTVTTKQALPDVLTRANLAKVKLARDRIPQVPVEINSEATS